MKELFIYFLWENFLYSTPLKTVEGDDVSVLNAGERNNDSGPDYLFSKIKIGNTEWVGNVEMHIKSSMWYLHGHDRDKAYDNVILHVVYEYDGKTLNSNGVEVPVVEMKGKFDEKYYMNFKLLIESKKTVSCEKQLSSIPEIDKFFWLERLVTDRLEEKFKTIQSDSENYKTGFGEIFYRKLAGSFGLKTNKDAFESLAFSLPLKILQKHGDNRLQVEALLFGNAGFLNGDLDDTYYKTLRKEYEFLSVKYNLKSLNPVVWRFMRMRPNNFPTVRLSQFAGLVVKLHGDFVKLVSLKHLSDLYTILDVETSEYWKTHYKFGKVSSYSSKRLGKHSVNSVIINSVIPFTFFYGKIYGVNEYVYKALDWLENIPPEDNKIVRLYKEAGFPVKNAMHTQAMLVLKNSYCDKKRCVDCAIGRKVMAL